MAANSYRRLTCSKNACRGLYRISGIARGFSRDCGEKPSDVLRLSLDFRSKNKSVELQFPGLVHCRLDKQAIVGNHVIVDILEDGISGFRSLGNGSVDRKSV